MALTSGDVTVPPGLDLPGAGALIGVELDGGELITGGRSNLTYRVWAADGRDWVVRRPPLGHVLSTAHDMGREFAVISALAPTAVPVPRALARSMDPSFYVMEYVPGPVYRTPAELAPLGPQRIRVLMTNLVDVLAELHSLDPDAVGLGGFGRPEGYLERQLKRWHKQLDASRSRVLDGIDELHDLLAQRIPASARTGLVHGDYRIDNCVATERDGIAAVLDWEMATLGDPLTDVGLLLMYWRLHMERYLDGVPTGPELAAYYAQRRGLELGQLDWYLAFANYKLAVIAEGIHYRYRAGQTVGDGFAEMGELVPQLIAHGHAALKGQ